MRKTRSIAPSRSRLFNHFKVTKRKVEVQPTYEETFKASIDAMRLDEEDQLVQASKRRRLGFYQSSRSEGVLQSKDVSVEVDGTAARVFRSIPAEVSLDCNKSSFISPDYCRGPVPSFSCSVEYTCKSHV